MPRATAVWNRGLQFVGTSGSGHAVLADATKEAGGFDAAPTPTELLLIGLCACTGMDVVSILEKRRVALDDLHVEAEAEIATDGPKRLTRIELVYRVWGAEVPAEAVERAIELSREKYCTVSNTLNGRAEICHRYEINPER